MCEEMLDVVFEILNDGRIGVELRCFRWGWETTTFYIEACEAEEVELASVIVILRQSAL